MRICLTDLATAPSHQIQFDYTIDLSKEEVSFAFPFHCPLHFSWANISGGQRLHRC